jgi:hypothetical protein
MPNLLRRALAPIAIATAIALVYWPGLYGFWGRDDFMQLAFARMVGSPWPLFVHDHYFPVPGSIFRPLGFASFWLWQALFGTDYFAHAFGDMLLHVAVALALYRVVRVDGLERIPAALCALVFALHPVVLGAALWWSARFDLLAALFALLALRAAFDHMDRPRPASLITTSVAALAALLSKETALALIAAVGLMWLRWAWTDRAHRANAIRALVALACVTIAFITWRWLVLGTGTTGLIGEMSLVSAIGKGFADWFAYLADYLSFWPRLGAVERFIVAAVGVGLTVCIVFGWRKARPVHASSHGADLLICGFCLFALPAVLQAPVVALNATPLRADFSAVEAAMQSRLYYLSIGGAVIMLSVLIRRASSAGDALRIPMMGMLALAAGAFGWVSHEAAAEYASRSLLPKTMAEAAAAAVDRLELPVARCHVVLLGVEPPVEWGIYVSMDAVVKALSESLHNVDRCFIHSDYVTYFNLMGGTATPVDASPYLPHEAAGAPVPWLHVGDAVIAYLDPPHGSDVETTRGMLFLRYEDGVFRDVTADVAAGRMSVDLR